MTDVLAHISPGGEAALERTLREEGIAVTDDPTAATYLIWGVHGQYEELRTRIRGMPNLRLVQFPSAGVDDFIAAGCLERRDVTYASCRGAFAVPVAEHAVALVLGLLRQLHVRARAQAWGPSAGTLLRDSDVLIVGRGGVGREVARLLEAFGARPHLLGREECAPAAADGSSAHAKTAPLVLHEALRRAGIVVLCCPLTPETHGLIGAPELAIMGRGAFLVNVARGAIVQTPALVHALRNGALAGAALDVTDPEPLPPRHPLWSLPNCLITPHTADTPEMIFPLVVARVVENARRLRRGAAVVGEIDLERGY